MCNEIWKTVVGFEEYEVSNLGRVRSFRKYLDGKILSLQNSNGYYCVSLTVNGKRKRFLVHRLVAQAFIPNPEGKPVVNHINGIKTDNRVENLEWCTQAENIRHACATGLVHVLSGEEHGRAKLTSEQVLYIRDNPDGLTQKELGKMFNLNQKRISDVKRGKTYRHVQRRPKVKLEPVTVAPLQVGFIIDCKIAFAPLHNCAESNTQLCN